MKKQLFLFICKFQLVWAQIFKNLTSWAEPSWKVSSSSWIRAEPSRAQLGGNTNTYLEDVCKISGIAVYMRDLYRLQQFPCYYLT